MKAKEYYSKYHSALVGVYNIPKDATPEERGNTVTRFEWAGQDLFSDLFKEMETLRIQRHAMSDRAMVSIVRELNQKYNVIARMFEEKDGHQVLKRDEFVRSAETVIPGILKYFPNVTPE